MFPINKNDFIPIGSIIKPHGLKGDLIVEIEDGYEEYLSGQDYLMVELEGGLVPFFFTDEGINFRTSTTLAVAFDGFHSAEKARSLCGCQIYLNKNISQDEGEEDGFDDLTGYLVFDNLKGKLGEISVMDNYAGNIVMTILHQDHEILVPFSEELITRIDAEKRELYMDCPEGLVDLYLEQTGT